MRLSHLLKDPPPEYGFELSETGIAFFRPGAKRSGAPEIGLLPLPAGVLSVSPLRDNVLKADELAALIDTIAPANGCRKRRPAVVILPDYSTRVAVLDFDAFPSEAAEQLSLVRFRVKKSVPFDVDSATVSFHAQPAGGGSKKIEVVAAVVALEIVARYEALFRGAGYLPGFVTTSALASLALVKPSKGTGDDVTLVAKLSGLTLTVSVVRGHRLKLIRCVEIPERTAAEVLSVLYPTVAYVEDEMRVTPSSLLVCGLDPNEERLRICWESELGVPAEPLRSRFGAPGQYNAGLLGYLEGQEG